MPGNNDDFKSDSDEICNDEDETCNDNDSKCAICLDGLNYTPILKLECGHIFHNQCISKYVIYIFINILI